MPRRVGTSPQRRYHLFPATRCRSPNAFDTKLAFQQPPLVSSPKRSKLTKLSTTSRPISYSLPVHCYEIRTGHSMPHMHSTTTSRGHLSTYEQSCKDNKFCKEAI